MKSKEEYIEKLRNASNPTVDWEICRDVTLYLFRLMQKKTVISIVVRFADSYFTDFKIRHPQDLWVNERLDWIREGLDSENWNPDVILSPPNQRYGTLGDNNFASAIEQLRQAVGVWKDSEKVSELCRDAISNIIMATTVAEWAQRNPELSSRLSNPKNKDDQMILSTHFRQDLTTIDYESRLWRELADEIANTV